MQSQCSALLLFRKFKICFMGGIDTLLAFLVVFNVILKVVLERK